MLSRRIVEVRRCRSKWPPLVGQTLRHVDRFAAKNYGSVARPVLAGLLIHGSRRALVFASPIGYLSLSVLMLEADLDRTLQHRTCSIGPGDSAETIRRPETLREAHIRS